MSKLHGAASVGVRRSLFRSPGTALTIGFALLVVAPVQAFTASIGEPELAPVRVVILTDTSGAPRRSAELLLAVLQDGGYENAELRFASSADTFLDQLGNPDAPILVLAGEGEVGGLRIGTELIPWPVVGQAVQSSQAQEVHLLACHSDILRRLLGPVVAKAYRGLVDAEYAALDVAYELAQRHLNGPALSRFGNAHTEHVMHRGGAHRFLQLRFQPQDALGYTTQDYCAAQMGSWRSPNPHAVGGWCPIYIDPIHNPSCTWSNEYLVQQGVDGGFRNACARSSQEQEAMEEEMESQSFADQVLHTLWDLIYKRIRIEHNAVVEGEKYEWWFSIGEGYKHHGGEVLQLGSEFWDGCISWVSIKDLVIPGITFTESFIRDFKQMVGDANWYDITAWELRTCVSMVFALREGGTTMHAAPMLDIRFVLAGAEVVLDLWFIVSLKLKFEMSFIYPMTLDGDLTIDRPNRQLTFNGRFSYGHGARFQIEFNALDILWSAPVPLPSGQSDALSYSWYVPCQWLNNCPAAQSNDPPLEAPSQTPARVDAAQTYDLAFLPGAAQRLRAPDQARLPIEGADGYQLSSITELRPGDAYLNHLRRSGALECLGVDEAALVVGQSLFLDRTHHAVRACLGDQGPGVASLNGLPGGLVIEASTCLVGSLGLVAVVQLENCAVDRAVPGLAQLVQLASGTDAAQPLAPSQIGVGYDLNGVNAAGIAVEFGGVVPLAQDQAFALAGTAEEQSRVLCLPVGAGLPSGHVLTLTEVCQMVAHTTKIRDGADWLRKAGEYQTAKVIEAVRGGYLWVVDGCEQATEFAGLDAADLNVCGEVEASSGSVAQDMQELSTRRVYEEYTDAMARIYGALAHDQNGEYAGGVFGQQMQSWTEHEEISKAVGRESQALGVDGPLRYVEDTGNAVLCSVSPSCA